MGMESWGLGETLWHYGAASPALPRSPTRQRTGHSLGAAHTSDRAQAQQPAPPGVHVFLWVVFPSETPSRGLVRSCCRECRRCPPAVGRGAPTPDRWPRSSPAVKSSRRIRGVFSGNKVPGHTFRSKSAHEKMLTVHRLTMYACLELSLSGTRLLDRKNLKYADAGRKRVRLKTPGSHT